jgi:RHS repeat-associated protein
MTAPSPVGGTATVITLYAYDANNHLCRVLEGATMSLATLDALTTPCSSILPNGIAISATQNVDTQYTYDTAGNMASQIVPADTLQPNPPASYATATTKYGYDEEGRLISETDPDGYVSGAIPASHTTTYKYDVNGNRATEIQPDGQTIAWYYDAANRLCQQAAGSSLTTPMHPCTDQVGGAALDTIYTHDGAGNMLSATDPLNPLGAQTISATYDAQNRPRNVSSTGGPTLSASPTDQTTYTYPDTATETRTDPSGGYTFNIDGLGRETAMADPLHTTASQYSWVYGLSGNTKSVYDPTGVFTCYGHDPLGHLTSTSTATSLTATGDCANAVSLYSYSYNAAGNETSATANLGSDPTNGTTNYTYDPLGRLTGYTLPTGSAVASSSQTYGWNSMPDRASVTTGSGTPVKTTTFFDAAGRPLSDTAGSGNTYSSNGNGQITGTPASTTTSTPGETLKYDDLGRLSEVDMAAHGQTPASIETSSYDPLGRLQTVSNSGGTTTRFLYVGLTNSVAGEVDGAGNILSEHATDIAGAELFDFTSAGSTVSYLGRNAHGDVTYARDQTGTVTSTAAYDPFGNVIATSGSRPSINDSAWQGSWFDGQTHLYYVEARWYSPTIGEFLSADPLVHETADPQDRDLYAYGSGDAIGKSDPSGESCVVNGDAVKAGCGAPTMQAPPTSMPASPPWFSQYRPKGNPWYSDWMGGEGKSHGCGRTIGDIPGEPMGFGQGCAIVTAAEVVALRNGFNSTYFNPGLLNDWLAEQPLYVGKYCDLYWKGDRWQSKWHVAFKEGASIGPYTKFAQVPAATISDVAKSVSKGVPVIAHIIVPGKIPTHYVEIIAVGKKDFVVNDPAQQAPATGFFGSGYRLVNFVSVHWT